MYVSCNVQGPIWAYVCWLHSTINQKFSSRGFEIPMSLILALSMKASISRNWYAFLATIHKRCGLHQSDYIRDLTKNKVKVLVTTNGTTIAHIHNHNVIERSRWPMAGRKNLATSRSLAEFRRAVPRCCQLMRRDRHIEATSEQSERVMTVSGRRTAKYLARSYLHKCMYKCVSR